MRFFSAGMFGLLLCACGGHANVQCENNGNCDLSGGGMCVAASTGNLWCAYPDPACPSGYRYSNDDVGDGVGGVCVDGSGQDAGVDAEKDAGTDASPVAVTHRLTLMVGGSGVGNVMSTPTGFTCSSGTCTHDFADGTSTSLAATATTGSFLGWSNDCTGAGSCDLLMDRDHVVTALFGSPGEAIWSQQIGGAQDDFGTAIAADGDGNLIVVGNFSGSFVVAGTTLTSNGGVDFFVAKLNGTDGSISWIKTFGGIGGESAASVALDAANNIYIGGTFSNSISFGADTLQSAGNGDGFALKLDAAGAPQWARSIGGTGSDGAAGIAVRGTSVAVVGSFSGSMTVNGTTVSTPGTSQGFLVTLGTDGSSGIVKTFPGSGYSGGQSVSIDSSNNIVLCGSLSGSADFGGGTVTSNNGDAFLAKYSSAGTYLLSKVLGASSSGDACTAVRVGPLDDIFLIGGFSGQVPFGGANPLDAGTGSTVVARFSAAGAYKWAKAFNGTSAQVAATSGAVNSTGDIVAVGYFCGSVMFGSTQLSSVGTCANRDYDIFALRLSGTDGTPLSAARAGGSSQDGAEGVAQTPDGRHFVVGEFQGFADFGGVSRTSAGKNDAVILALAPL